ncbi:MAG: Fic family protein [Bacteroidales bacterium]|jgi:Fic family protein|nr:Fic family protein [Bacteroidales bacterium]
MKNFNSGTIINQGYYNAFIPNIINREWVLDNIDVQYLLSHADRLLGKMDMYSQYVDIDLFLKMHIVKEATQSSKIEGTQTNYEEAFMKKEDIVIERRDDWEELQNYISAMNFAVNELKTLPFSTRLIKQTHKILLQGVRGKQKLPGEFRRSQNWIGGVTINEARFIPPPHTEVQELISDLEKFANNENNRLPDLLKIALIHYQFETIHPFLDGNGRIGRLLITLFLVSKGILKYPILYLSDFFERHRDLYYDNLTIVRRENDINQWLKFFLVGVMEISNKGIETFDGILKLQKSINERIAKLGVRAEDARNLINCLYKKPIINAIEAQIICNKSLASIYKLLSDLEKMGILHEITGGQRGRNYIFKEYIELF